MKNHIPLLICMFWVTISGCVLQAEATNGASGIGDSYYPQLGNGGYDVQKYTIILDVDPESNMVHGKTIIEAKSTEKLNSFNLDFQGLTTNSVSVNGSNASFVERDGEMTVTPTRPLSLNRAFTVEVSYEGRPTPLPSATLGQDVGWFHAQDGTINVFTEPDGASAWFPNNNHPRDKALYHLDIQVPKPWVVAATGTLKEKISEGDHIRYLVNLEDLAASYLVSVNIGKYQLEESKSPSGILIRNYFPPDYPELLRKNFDKLPEMIDFLSSVYGPYPFSEYGVVITSSEGSLCNFAGADETQTLSLHCPQESAATESVIVHELAHQWFGDSVSLKNWKDVWLKEGMATYAEWLWRTRDKDLAILNKVVKAQIVGYYPSTSIGEPPKDSLYRDEVYKGGALVFHALRLRVGEEAFFKILRTYLERYRDSSAGTDEFIALSEEISGQDLTEFFDSWLLDNQLPEMPE